MTVPGAIIAMPIACVRVYRLRLEDGQLNALAEAQVNTLKSSLREIFVEVGAEVIITFGPDGYTGHADHIAIGAIATDLMEEWCTEADVTDAPGKLYHTMCPASLAAEVSLMPFVPVDDGEATTIVDRSDGIPEAQAGVLAYETQFSSTELAYLQSVIGNSMEGRIHLRWVLAKTGELSTGEVDIFE